MNFLNKDEMFVLTPSFNQERVKEGSFVKVTKYYETTGKGKERAFKLPEPKIYNALVSTVISNAVVVRDAKGNPETINTKDLERGYFDLVVYEG